MDCCSCIDRSQTNAFFDVSVAVYVHDPAAHHLLRVHLPFSTDTSCYAGIVLKAIVHDCVAAVDRRGLNVDGIYLAGADEQKSQGLVDKYLLVEGHAASSSSKQSKYGHRRPNFQVVVDIHEVAWALKFFLRGLDEPLTTFAEYSAFIFVARGLARKDEQHRQCCDALSKLPTTSFHTLRTIVDHLKRVGSAHNGTTIDVLARAFTLYFFRSPEGRQGDERDAEVQLMATMVLLTLPAEYWDTAEKEVTINGDAVCASPVPKEQALKRQRSNGKILKMLND
jgi:hypothetical protein